MPPATFGGLRSFGSATNQWTLHASDDLDLRPRLAAPTCGPDLRPEAVPIVRGLIERVTVTPNDGSKGVDVEVTGKLANILPLAAGKAVRAPDMFLLERAKPLSPTAPCEWLGYSTTRWRDADFLHADQDEA